MTAEQARKRWLSIKAAANSGSVPPRNIDAQVSALLDDIDAQIANPLTPANEVAQLQQLRAEILEALGAREEEREEVAKAAERPAPGARRRL